jgi:hypothetical protein
MEPRSKSSVFSTHIPQEHTNDTSRKHLAQVSAQRNSKSYLLLHRHHKEVKREIVDDDGETRDSMIDFDAGSCFWLRAGSLREES